jgi:AraC-like DNA-binding protein/ligand-binding sensor protein
MLKIDFEKVIKPSMTLCKLRDLFRASTGLDFFLCYRDVETGICLEKPFSDTMNLPTLCELVQNSQKGCHACCSSHQVMMERSVKTQSPDCQTCHMGLVTIHYPILINDEVVGNIQTVCSLPYGDRARLETLSQRIAKDYGVTEAEVKKAIAKMPVLTKKKEKQVLEWLELVLCMISEASFRVPIEEAYPPPLEPSPEHHDVEYQIRLEVGRKMTLPPWRGNRSTGGCSLVVDSIKTFIENNYNLSVSSKVISQALGFEESYFSKMFKKCSRLSFTEFVQDIRMSKAKELLINEPYLNIQEISLRVGYKNPAYFSRIFQKTVGVCPSKLKK